MKGCFLTFFQTFRKKIFRNFSKNLFSRGFLSKITEFKTKVLSFFSDICSVKCGKYNRLIIWKLSWDLSLRPTIAFNENAYSSRFRSSSGRKSSNNLLCHNLGLSVYF